MKIKINWTEEKMEKVKEKLEDFINEYGVTCCEDIQQCDGPSIASLWLVADLVDLLVNQDDEVGNE